MSCCFSLELLDGQSSARFRLLALLLACIQTRAVAMDLPFEAVNLAR
jgi:hypothetical protein